MGYLVLQEKEDSVFSVIDGQQRFTTFSLIVLAAASYLFSVYQVICVCEKHRHHNTWQLHFF
jgi:hypothetical protein